MITAVDTSVLLDVFVADRAFGAGSKEAIHASLAKGGLVACCVVWAEIAGFFPSPEGAREALERLGIGFGSISRDAALEAGRAWNAYRRRGGSRARMIADFLIAAHAQAHADRLLTRDRGFYRTYFRNLRILEPG